MSNAPQRPAASKEEPQKKCGTASNNHDAGDAHQEFGCFADLRIPGLGYRYEVSIKVHCFDEAMALVGYRVAAHEDHEGAAAPNFK